MTAMYVATALGSSGDVFRIPAQVISGVGFLGAGMIILKPNNMITGLTTTASVWTTATIGVALGYGYYVGALTVTVLFLSTIILLEKLERKRKSAEVVYLEIDDAYKTNAVLRELETQIPESFTYQLLPPKSGIAGNVGLSIFQKFTKKTLKFPLLRLIIIRCDLCRLSSATHRRACPSASSDFHESEGSYV